MRPAVLAVLAALTQLACGDRCKDVAYAKAALAQHGVGSRGADVRVTVPYDHANRVIAGLLAQQPLTMELAPPELRLIPVRVKPVAIVREAILQQADGAAGSVRLATRFEIRDGELPISEVAATIELRPVIANGRLVLGFGPQQLVRVRPTLAPASKETLRAAVDRWVPERLRARLPSGALDGAAKQLGQELTGAAWDALRGSLLQRLGEITRIQVQLPDVPIARHHLRSEPRGLIVELETDLPVRRGLAPATPIIGDDLGVRISASAAAELANWALDRGLGPTRWNRNLKPTPDGEFQPRFDYVAEDRAHPLKVYAFQQRGGCSYHRVGVRGAMALEGDTLKGTVLDRELEAQSAHPVIELGAWTQLALFGWIDRSKRIAAHTELVVGGRRLTTRLRKAAIERDELVFELEVDGAPPARITTAR